MKPNVLLLVADQFRADCLGCVGHPDVKTPNYDALAADGTLFTEAYSPNPICVPARATMITGMYPHKCLTHPDKIKNNGGWMKEDQVRLPQLMAENGYATYSSGKLHYLPYQPPGEERTLNGFQHAVISESGRMLKQFDPKNTLRGVEDYADYLEDVGWKGYTRAHGIGNNDVHPAPSPLPQEHCVDAWVASEAIRYIDQHLENESDKPFLLHASFPKPHSPYDPPRPYDSMYDPREIQTPAQNLDEGPRSPHMDEGAIGHGFNYLSPEAIQVSRAHYYGLISFQDAQVGRIINHLKEKGLYQNTIIVFMADHGDMLGDFGWFFKSCMYEGSAKVPFMIAWPGKLPKEQVSNALVGLQDVVPTVLDLAGIELPQPVDGISLRNELQGSKDGRRECIVSYSLDAPRQTYMIRDEQYKYIYSEANGVEELYDLASDPREETNLSTNPEFQSKLEALKSKMIDWSRENDDEKILEDGKLVATPLDTDTLTFNAGGMGWRWY